LMDELLKKWGLTPTKSKNEIVNNAFWVGSK